MSTRLLSHARCICAVLLITESGVLAQHSVDPRNMYERVVAVVPWVGKGIPADPKRPLYAPIPGRGNPTSRSGILAYTCQESDTGLLAICEFVAADRNALKPILGDPTLKVFLKGRDRREAVETELKKYRKDFDISTFGVRLP